MKALPIDDDPHDEGHTNWYRADHLWLELTIVFGFLILVGTTSLCLILTISPPNEDKKGFMLFSLAYLLLPLLSMVVIGSFVLGCLVRRWVLFTPEGFVVATFWKRTVYRDGQVVALGWEHNVSPLPGLSVRSYRLHLVVQTELGRKHVWLSLPSAVDPVEIHAFLNRLTQQIERRAEREGRLEGIGWHLDAEGFHHQGRVTPRERIVVRTTDEQYLRLYRDDEWRPFTRFKLGDANVRLLPRLLQRTSDPDASHPLGRWLFTLPLPEDARALVVGSAGLALACVVTLVTGLIASSGLLLAASVIFLFCTLLQSLILGVVVWLRRGRIDVHERGLCQPHLGRTLRFEHLRSMPIEWPYYPGFIAEPGSASQSIVSRIPIRLSRHQAGFRFIAQTLARRWRQRLEAGERVPWTPHLAFHALGLEIQRATFLGGSKHLFMPYGNLELYFTFTSVVLYPKERGSSLREISLSTENYFAGLILLEWLLHPETAPQEEILRRWTTEPAEESVHRPR